ncbi:MAG: hypothetical protein OXP69_07595 [Spirochaetaceae bacterium]|nr:hypothetical protein [Spirochaetaceae bacterium]
MAPAAYALLGSGRLSEVLRIRDRLRRRVRAGGLIGGVLGLLRLLG